MDLLTNAIESIQVGVEDYKAGTRPRLLSAVRNIHAGILLLFKEALRRHSPRESKEVLVMAKIAPARDRRGRVVFTGEGRKTVDAQQIRERFAALGINTDWQRFDRINDARNDVEHLFPKLDQKALDGLISNTFLLVRNFVSDELQDDPLGLLGETTWQKMLEVTEVYEAQNRECEELIAKATWESDAVKRGVSLLACLSCGGGPWKPFEGPNGKTCIRCCSCGLELEPEEYRTWAEMVAEFAADQDD